MGVRRDVMRGVLPLKEVVEGTGVRALVTPGSTPKLPIGCCGKAEVQRN
jgi:hypothetical protein